MDRLSSLKECTPDDLVKAEEEINDERGLI
jgi:hypothetical protein